MRSNDENGRDRTRRFTRAGVLSAVALASIFGGSTAVADERGGAEGRGRDPFQKQNPVERLFDKQNPVERLFDKQNPVERLFDKQNPGQLVRRLPPPG